jgi:hypothetical protein
MTEIKGDRFANLSVPIENLKRTEMKEIKFLPIFLLILCNIVSADSGLLEIGYFGRFCLESLLEISKILFLKHKLGAAEEMDQNIFCTNSKKLFKKSRNIAHEF